jgi:magnesium chelatase subunit I
MNIDSIRTLGQLRASGYRSRPVKDELRENALRRLREREELFPGIVGFDRTVVPEIVNAILSKHDFILLGLRGQAKTRLVRSLVRFLDPALPAIEGTPLPDDPFAPVTAMGRRLLREGREDTPICWLAPEERYHEKLATPDVTIADLIGDVDPIKAANEGRNLDDEEIIQYGLVPRGHRGIFALNELPDLAPRIQVGLFNIMEEKDVQIRGFPVRLPVDVLMVFTANPEDYTNRGSIITPLKDRIDSQIHTHYPASLDDAMRITEQEAWTLRGPAVHVPAFLRRIIDEVVFLARESDFVDPASGVSARASISAYENVLSNVERRSVLHPSDRPVARICDLAAMIPALTGKIELAYEGEQEGVTTVCRDLIGKAVKRLFLENFPDPKARTGRAEATALDGPLPEGKQREVDHSVYGDIVGYFAQQNRVELSDLLSNEKYEARLDAVTGLGPLVRKHMKLPENEVHAGMELVLEGLYQCSFVGKENLDRATLYSDMLLRMFEGMGKQAKG